MTWAPSPPTRLADDNPTSAAVDRREWKRGRRAVLAQCDRCLCNGTASVNARGRIVSLNLAAAPHPARRWVHLNCGGTFLAYDIEVGE